MRLTLTDLLPNSDYALQLRSISDTDVSAWSIIFNVHTIVDTVPPAIPSAPIVQSRLGNLQVSWDGKNAAGTAMDTDFKYVKVHVSTTSGFTPSAATFRGTISAAGVFVVTDLTYQTVYYIRLVAVDTSGNESAASVQASAQILPLVDTDLIGEIVDGAHIKDGTIVASDKVIANTITGALIQALAIDTGNLAANAVTADKIAAGAITTDKITVGAVTPILLGFGTENLIPDASFENAAYRAFRVPPAGMTYEIAGEAGNTGYYVKSAVVDGSSTSFYMLPVAAEINTNPGQKIFLRARIARNSAANGTFSLGLRVTLRNGSFSYLTAFSFTNSTFTDIDTWVYQEGIITIPDNAISSNAQLISVNQTAGSWFIDDTEMRFVLMGGTGGSSAEISPQGIRLLDSQGSEMVSLTSVPPNYLSISKNDPITGEKTTVASINENGLVAATDLATVNDPIIVGRNLLGTFENFNPSGDTSSLGWLDRLPRGTVSYADWSGTAVPIPSNQELGLFEIAFDAYEGRMYSLNIDDVRANLSNNAYGGFVIRYEQPTTPGGVANAPTTTSPIMSWAYMPKNTTGGTVGGTLRMQRSIPCQANPTGISWAVMPGTVRILVSLISYVGTIDIADTQTLTARVDDVGLVSSDLSVLYNNGSPPPPTQPPKKTYVTTWPASWSRSFSGSGAYIAYYGSNMNQGYYDTTWGNQSAMAGFPSVTSTLSGAVINKVELYILYNHWYYDAGGTAILGLHGQVNPPSTKSGLTGLWQISNWGRGVGKWISLGSSYFNGFLSGAYRGLLIGPGPSTSREYYGRADGVGDDSPPQLRITYTK